jgi:hypothetical protein
LLARRLLSQPEYSKDFVSFAYLSGWRNDEDRNPPQKTVPAQFPHKMTKGPEDASSHPLTSLTAEAGFELAAFEF